jgi:hypothetical protein
MDQQPHGLAVGVVEQAQQLLVQALVALVVLVEAVLVVLAKL